MPITNDREMRMAIAQAGALLQEVQQYVGREIRPDAKVRFPRGFLHTAARHRTAIDYVADGNLRDNMAYTMILADTVHWMLIRTPLDRSQFQPRWRLVGRRSMNR